MANLYLIPTPIDEGAQDILLPSDMEIVRGLDYFAAERARTARRQLRRWFADKELGSLRIVEWDKHAGTQPFDEWLAPVLAGRSLGVMSEAGCPGVADPGAGLVAAAHRLGITVRPMVGPSSLLLGLMASGMNGQGFRFAGYLPAKAPALDKAIRELEQRSAQSGETQIFIETPYRNKALLGSLLRQLGGGTRLCVAAGLTGPGERVVSLPVRAWGGVDTAWLEKTPAVFYVLAGK